jgi:benzodiazapine receptor
VTPEGCVFNNQGQFKVRYSHRHEMTALAGFLALCLAVGLSGSGLSFLGLHSWYLALHQPVFCPPVWVFLPVWTVLYFMTGLAAWEIWRVPGVGLQSHRALNAWGWQIGLKALWTPVFLGLHWLLPALLVGAALCGTILWTTLRFSRLNPAAACLMLPYFGWVLFELYLNAGFWWLNH